MKNDFLINLILKINVKTINKINFTPKSKI